MATREKRLSAFTQNGFPHPDVLVQVLCEDKSGTYVPPFDCFYRDGHWIGASEGKSLDVSVIGWRLTPTRFRQER